MKADTLALVTLSREGLTVARRLRAAFSEAGLYVHEAAGEAPDAQRFKSVTALTKKIFPRYRRLVYIAPCGVVVRALDGAPRSKLTDPAVVVVDVGARWAISLLSGHEGGANELAVAVGNVVGAEPVITTTTEAVKSVIVGVGLRRGKDAASIVAAVRHALDMAGVSPDEVRLIASVDIKSDEQGLIEAARILGAPARFIGSEEIREAARGFARSEFVQSKVGLPAVAEPAALLAGRRTSLLLTKIKKDGVTVALARERFT